MARWLNRLGVDPPEPYSEDIEAELRNILFFGVIILLLRLDLSGVPAKSGLFSVDIERGDEKITGTSPSDVGLSLNMVLRTYLHSECLLVRFATAAGVVESVITARRSRRRVGVINRCTKS